MSTMVSLKRGQRSRVLLAVVAAALLAGCANRDSITVGSVPDDYRTNHPIVVGERTMNLDLPVAASGHRLTRGQASVVAGFLDDYDGSSGGTVNIMVPFGSANSAAASSVSSQMIGVLQSQGVPHDRIAITSYDAGAPDVSAPIRITYTAVKASVAGKCGRWPEDLTANSENKHWANFGCAYQNNLAAQIADPNDLLGPRKSTEIDPENRAGAIDQYKQRGVSEEFLGRSEIFY